MAAAAPPAAELFRRFLRVMPPPAFPEKDAILRTPSMLLPNSADCFPTSGFTASSCPAPGGDSLSAATSSALNVDGSRAGGETQVGRLWWNLPSPRALIQRRSFGNALFDMEIDLAPPAIVVIGASAGGVQALQELVSGLDPSLPVVWCAVLHVDAHGSEMPSLLSRAGRLPACHAGNGDPLEPGRIYLPPPDLHLIVEDGHVVLSRGPRENWTRPAIDPLFRSAAANFGASTIGIILTGRLNDGTAGLLAVKQAGGTAVVQDPREAQYPAMPRNALRYVSVDHCVTLAEMPPLITRLVLRAAAPRRGRSAMGEGHV